MGAHDWIDDSAPCPSCGRVHPCEIQFDFRFPDYHDVVTLRRGEWVAGSGLDLDDVTGSGYARVRSLGDGPVVVAEELDLYSVVCGCSAALLAGVAVEVDLSGRRLRMVEPRWLALAAFLDPSSPPPAHYVPEDWVTERSPQGARSVPSTHERRRALFAEHVRRWLADSG